MTHPFDPAVYAARIARTAAEAQRAGLAGVIVGTGPELAYLTGSWLTSHERLTALSVTADGKARLVVPATDIGGLTLPGVEVLGWRDGEDPYRLAAAPFAADPAGPEGPVGPVGLGTSLTADHVLRLHALLPRTVLAAQALSAVFAVKEEAELRQIEAAAAAIDRVHERVPQLLRPGRTEAEVAADLQELILARHDTVDFVIVGSGPNGANPHHSHSSRVLGEGDPVVVDIGGSLGAGYHSDCTRTYRVGGTDDPEFDEAYAVLERAQREAVAAAKPGMTAGELDAVARGIIGQAGYAEYFTHRTGHGLGLSLHEEPFIVAGNETLLREGMVFSIEPGIYVPGKWGMRIEDIVTLTADGARSLNSCPRHLR